MVTAKSNTWPFAPKRDEMFSYQVGNDCIQGNSKLLLFSNILLFSFQGYWVCFIMLTLASGNYVNVCAR